MIHSDPLTLPDEAFLTRARAMCTTKVPHPNRQAATAAMRRGSFNGTPYRCPICDAWHTTTSCLRAIDTTCGGKRAISATWAAGLAAMATSPSFAAPRSQPSAPKMP